MEMRLVALDHAAQVRATIAGKAIGCSLRPTVGCQMGRPGYSPGKNSGSWQERVVSNQFSVISFQNLKPETWIAKPVAVSGGYSLSTIHHPTSNANHHRYCHYYFFKWTVSSG
ncbi:MAG: hypothetical protein IID13_07755 [Candidatus Marinimicrobia bacterium]|nr:hypothetical protein [Candidatus Neomarinimicrobiota bacterium]